MKYEASSILAKISFPSWDQILKVIDPKDLGPDGLESNPHITILDGIEVSVEHLDIIKVAQDWLKPSIIIGQFAIFENPEFDVVYLKVDSFDLGVCRELAKVIPNYQTFQHYTPHITVAYLKPGTARKYLDIPLHIPHDAYEVESFEISMASGTKYIVPPKFIVLNYEKYLKHISHKEFVKMNVEKSGLVATVIDSAFISGHSYNKGEIIPDPDDPEDKFF